jgi:hypothetical protein
MVLDSNILTSTRAGTGSVRLDRKSSIGIGTEAAALFDRSKNFRKRLGGLISANDIVVFITTIGLYRGTIGTENAGALTGCEVGRIEDSSGHLSYDGLDYYVV